MSARNALLLCLAAACGLAGAAVWAADQPAPAPTIKDLGKRKVDVRVDGPSRGTATRAMDNYRRFLELQNTDPDRRAEALRRLGDLSLESGELERLESEVNKVDLGGAEAILQLRAAQLSQDDRWTRNWLRPRKHRRAAGSGRLVPAT